MGDWAALEQATIDGVFRFSPSHARGVGDHRLDGVVGDVSRTAIQARIAEIDRQLRADQETRGLGHDHPMYLNYTLGKLLILELRQEMQRRPDYSLKRFHDAFLDCGTLPIPLIRDLIG